MILKIYRILPFIIGEQAMTKDVSILDRLNKIALRWSWGRPFLLVLMVFSVVYCGYVLVASDENGQAIYFIPSLLLFIWSLLSLTFLNAFRQVPMPSVQSDTWGQRLWNKLKRLAYYLLTILLGCATISVLVVTWRLLSTWRTMY